MAFCCKHFSCITWYATSWKTCPNPVHELYRIFIIVKPLFYILQNIYYTYTILPYKSSPIQIYCWQLESLVIDLARPGAALTSSGLGGFGPASGHKQVGGGRGEGCDSEGSCHALCCLIHQTFGCFGRLHIFECYIYDDFIAQRGCKHFMIENHCEYKIQSQGICHDDPEYHSFRGLHFLCGAKFKISGHPLHTLEVLALLYISEALSIRVTLNGNPSDLHTWNSLPLSATWGGFHTAILTTGKWLFVGCCFAQQHNVTTVIVCRCYTFIFNTALFTVCPVDLCRHIFLCKLCNIVSGIILLRNKGYAGNGFVWGSKIQRRFSTLLTR